MDTKDVDNFSQCICFVKWLVDRLFHRVHLFQGYLLQMWGLRGQMQGQMEE